MKCYPLFNHDICLNTKLIQTVIDPKPWFIFLKRCELSYKSNRKQAVLHKMCSTQINVGVIKNSV